MSDHIQMRGVTGGNSTKDARVGQDSNSKVTNDKGTHSAFPRNIQEQNCKGKTRTRRIFRFDVTIVVNTLMDNLTYQSNGA